jgi:hypothetical protein
MLQKRIGRRIDAMTPALLIQLKKIYQSLKDEMSKPSDWFDIADAPKETMTVADLKNRGKASDPTPAPEGVDGETGEIVNTNEAIS